MTILFCGFFLSLQLLLLPITQAVTLMSSVVTMANVFLTATHVMVIMTVEIIVMKTDVVWFYTQNDSVK